MGNLRWETIAYEKENGEIPVETFLNSLPSKHAEKVNRDIQLLGRFGTRWGDPHVEHLGGDIWELRTKHGSNIFRILFFRWHHTILILTNDFQKKSQKTPKREIQVARRYRDDWLHRRKGE